jgi:hypothetical protein
MTDTGVRRPQQQSPAGPASDSELDLLDGGSSQDFENTELVIRLYPGQPYSHPTLKLDSDRIAIGGQISTFWLERNKESGSCS